MPNEEWLHRNELCDNCKHVGLRSWVRTNGSTSKRFCHLGKEIKPIKNYNNINDSILTITLTCPKQDKDTSGLVWGLRGAKKSRYTEAGWVSTEEAGIWDVK